jgi:hypothetical protein
MNPYLTNTWNWNAALERAFSFLAFTTNAS